MRAKRCKLTKYRVADFDTCHDKFKRCFNALSVETTLSQHTRPNSCKK